jgi:hypothetical protein
MNQSERDELRKKHYQIGDGYICAYCWFYAGEEDGHEQVLYPCDVIRSLDAWEARELEWAYDYLIKSGVHK